MDGPNNDVPFYNIQNDVFDCSLFLIIYAMGEYVLNDGVWIFLFSQLEELSHSNGNLIQNHIDGKIVAKIGFRLYLIIS